MLNDEHRNSALERMVASLDLVGSTVLEIGTGCGLVALLFAKYGAAHVHTCEINNELADVAAATIARTAFRNRITVHRKSSAVLVRSGILSQPPDIIFTETLDCGVVGEGFFSIAQDIRRVAGPATQVLPSLVRQFGTLVEADTLRKLNEVDTACCFDLSAANIHSTQTYYPIRERLHEYTPLSEPFRLRDYSYVGREPVTEAVVAIQRSGSADGVISWFEARFGNETVSNRLGSHGHWHQAFHPLGNRTPVVAGTSLALFIDDDGRISICAK
jgi:type II protein arginine methyltransferase